MNTIAGFGHLALKVKDIDKSLKFYTQGLGLQEMTRLHDSDGKLFLIYLRVTDTEYLELFPEAVGNRAPLSTANGVTHFCFTVENIEHTVERLRAGGVKFTPWDDDGTHAVESPTIGMGMDGNRGVTFQDPDGNRIELMEMADNCLQYQSVRKLKAAAV